MYDYNLRRCFFGLFYVKRLFSAKVSKATNFFVVAICLHGENVATFIGDSTISRTYFLSIKIYKGVWLEALLK